MLLYQVMVLVHAFHLSQVKKIEVNGTESEEVDRI